MPVRAAAPPAPALDVATWRVLAAGLASPDYATRLVATDALGCLRVPQALAALADRLGDPEPDVRAAAIDALARQRSAPATTLLASVRDDEDERLELRVLAAAALVSLPPACPERR